MQYLLIMYIELFTSLICFFFFQGGDGILYVLVPPLSWLSMAGKYCWWSVDCSSVTQKRSDTRSLNAHS